MQANYGHRLPRRLQLYAFGASLGGQRVLGRARAWRSSRIPAGEPDAGRIAEATYSHNDPNSAYPDNEFVDSLVPFLKGIQKK